MVTKVQAIEPLCTWQAKNWGGNKHCFLFRIKNIFLNFKWFGFFSIIAGLQRSANFLLYRKVTQSHIHSFSHIILHCAPSQVTRYSSQCNTAGSHCLSIPNAIVCINPRFPVHPTPSPTSISNIPYLIYTLFNQLIHRCQTGSEVSIICSQFLCLPMWSSNGLWTDWSLNHPRNSITPKPRPSLARVLVVHYSWIISLNF